MLSRSFMKQQAGSGSPVASLGTMNAADEEPYPTTAIARVSFGTDGSITYIGNGSGGATAWFSPTEAGIGSNYYIKRSAVSGTAAYASNITTTVQAISATRYMEWRTTTGAYATVTIYIYSDSGGTNQVSSGTISVIAESI